MRIRLQVVELLAAVGITNETPPLASDGMVALIVRCDCWPLSTRLRIFELRHETDAFEIVARGQATQLAERWVKVQQLDWLRGAGATCDSRSGKDQRHARGSLPQRILARDGLL